MSWFLYSLLLFLSVEDTFLTLAEGKSNVHIIYMGRRQHEDTELITKTHHEMLSSVLGSKEATEDSMVYSYKHGFSGFAAKLTESQAQTLSELPDVVQVIPNRLYKLRTTRSWDYLGLSSHSPTNLLHDTHLGDGAIIGVLDTGIWPESEAFNDRDLGEIPSRWKGFCEPGESFDPKKNCNKKLIGARFFKKGLEAEQGRPYNTTKYSEYSSPRDSIGHGTHVSATAAGSYVANASYNGLARGTARGGAPRARLAMYKVCWNLDGGVCSHADLMKACDEAIHDGVDVLSVSIGSGVPLFTDVDERDGVQFGAFHAVERGISVVCAAGNSGPLSQTVENTAPWVLTVAASTVDRSFPTPIMLGNNQTLVGQAMFMGKDTGFISLMYPEVPDIRNTRYCENLSPSDISMAGKIVLCFTLDVTQLAMAIAEFTVLEAGGAGLIVARNPSNTFYSCTEKFPCVEVSFEIGTQILRYIRSTRYPKVRLRPSKSYVGKPVSTNVAYFSSRGPSSLSPAVLKPDIAAPGVNILAAVPHSGPNKKGAFSLKSGTSMATPHVSGIVALLKSLHSDWSPAAIKSAIITTAWTTDPSGEPIFAEGDPIKLADPFDFGGGLVNANKARKPGLIYDMGIEDYTHYLCAMGYDNTSINKLIKHTTFCPKGATSILNVNLPSITVPSLKNSITLTRTVTNVGPVNSKYQAIIESPPGILIAVKPDILIFDSNMTKVSFTVMISTRHRVNTGYGFGSLTWTDGVHFVRSPISVRTEIAKYYTD